MERARSWVQGKARWCLRQSLGPSEATLAGPASIAGRVQGETLIGFRDEVPDQVQGETLGGSRDEVPGGSDGTGSVPVSPSLSVKRNRSLDLFCDLGSTLQVEKSTRARGCACARARE